MRSYAPTRCSAASATRDRSSRQRRSSRPTPSRRPSASGTPWRAPVPLRHVPEDRGGSAHVARLIRTEKEVEGRYTEQWVVVEEDAAIDQWPAGPRETVGRPVPRVDGYERARGQALFTADVALPGMLHAAVLRSPYARARVKRLDLSRAQEAGWVLGAIGPDDCDALTLEPGFHGEPVAAVAGGKPGRAA